jgi:hypothetical protein
MIMSSLYGVMMNKFSYGVMMNKFAIFITCSVGS